nr:serine/threonine protein phosphatase [Haemonchus contortus]
MNLSATATVATAYTSSTSYTGLTGASIIPPSRTRCDRVDGCTRTVKCFDGRVRSTTDTVDCEGVCVMKMSYGRNRRKRRLYSGYLEGDMNLIFYCQNITAYPATVVNMCSDVKVQYPHLRTYKARYGIYLKYCCRTNYCNKNDVMILLPRFHYQGENIDQLYFEYFAIFATLTTIVILALWPAVLIFVQRNEERKLSTVLYQPLDSEVLKSSKAPEMKKERYPKPMTGQLSFWDLCRELTNMELRLRRPCTNLKPHSQPSYKMYQHFAGGYGHKLVKVERTTLVSYEQYILTQLMELGPYVYDWRPFELVSLLSQAADLFEGEATMLTIRTPIAIIGDIRGQYQDLHRWLCIAGFPPRQKVLFLGGVIDSGEPGSLDCLAFIAAMKARSFYFRNFH